MHVLDNGICITCEPPIASDVVRAHELVDGRCVTCSDDVVARRFDPSEPRDPHTGKWGLGGEAGTAVKDTLKLAGKIDLDKDEKLVGSGKVDSDIGGIRLAVTEQHGHKSIRLGAGSEGYGRANREEGIAAWDGNPTRAPLSVADHKRLKTERQALMDEDDADIRPTPARQKEIDDRLAEINERLNAPDFNGTAKLDQYSAGRLAEKIKPALAEAIDQEKAENKAWDEIEALEAKGNPDPARMAELQRIVNRGGPDRPDGVPDYLVFDHGIVPGDWGDVHWSVELDDPTQGPYVTLGVQPKGAPEDWGDGKDWTGQFDPAETAKFLKLLGQYTST